VENTDYCKHNKSKHIHLRCAGNLLHASETEREEQRKVASYYQQMLTKECKLSQRPDITEKVMASIRCQLRTKLDWTHSERIMTALPNKYYSGQCRATEAESDSRTTW